MDKKWVSNVVRFGDILFVFYFKDEYCGSDEIWCLDIRRKKWYKSAYATPKAFTDLTYIITDNNDQDLHLINFRDKKHWKVNGYDLIPNELVSARRQYYTPLISGYIRQQENKKLIPNIPFEVTQLILNFFPLFWCDCYYICHDLKKEVKFFVSD